MKQLTSDEIGNLSSEKAEEIIHDFGVFMQQSTGFCFESDLPWNKSAILAAILHALEDERDREMTRALHLAIIWLNNVIPDREKYESLAAIYPKVKQIDKDIRAGMKVDKILEKYNTKS
ncbi:MAG: hypothetical protein L0196_05965 [candidate division Zixibacteria bacterium]|nr:hypothetical protein [candidate division Zixibacteria bacterium]